MNQVLAEDGNGSVEARRRPKLNRKLLVGAFMVAAVVLLGLLGPVFWDTTKARAISGPPSLPPMWVEGGSAAHPLGTETLGRDMLALIIVGAPASLRVGFIAAGLGMLIAIILGFSAGFMGGWVDDLIRSVADAAVTIPAFAGLVVLAAYLSNLSSMTMALLLAAFAWPWPTRTIRAQVLSLRERGYVRMARLSGRSTPHIMFGEMVPNLLPYLVASFLGTVSGSILAATSLEALGLGPTRIPSLGIIVYGALQAGAVFRGMWWWWGPPVAVLMFIFIGLFLVATGLDEIVNPRLRRASVDKGRRKSLPARAPARAQTENEDLRGDEIVLDVRALRVQYEIPGRPVRAVNGVDLRVSRGEALGVVGESGCGKSTIAMAILGLVAPPGRIVDGEVNLNGVDIIQLDEQTLRTVRWKQVSLIPQGAMNSLNPVMRIRDQFAEVILAHEPNHARRQVGARIDELLQLVDLPQRVDSLYPHELSGGMKQRVAIAMAIALGPDLIVADEPTSALDVVVQRLVAQTLLDVKERLGVSLIVVGHDIALLAQLVDRMAVMHSGVIVEMAQTDAILNEPLHPQTQLLVSSVPSITASSASRAIGESGVPIESADQGPRVHSPVRFHAPGAATGTPLLREVRPDHFVISDADV